MSWTRRAEKYRFRRTVSRPIPLSRIVSTYFDRFSRYPEQVRILFSDGTTGVYCRKVEQPEPVVYRRR